MLLYDVLKSVVTWFAYAVNICWRWLAGDRWCWGCGKAGYRKTMVLQGIGLDDVTWFCKECAAKQLT